MNIEVVVDCYRNRMKRRRVLRDKRTWELLLPIATLPHMAPLLGFVLLRRHKRLTQNLQCVRSQCELLTGNTWGRENSVTSLADDGVDLQFGSLIISME